ncbi:sodium:solute symporter family protein [Scopulibacillus cellulosilyticus]|uniref:Sodium:solute symporter n=1 Tax=Scopulibacillus cellulosilyticus TaxID=2665665 RepID=A0ABW2PYK3_9BACL
MAALVFAVVILLTLFLALYSRRGNDMLNIEQYLVGGRSFGGILVFFLAVGEIYSIGTMIGFPGGIFGQGPSYGIWFLGYILLGYTLLYFIMPMIWRAGKQYGAMTVPDIFKHHYSHRGVEVVVAITIVIAAIPWAQLQFEGLAVALSALGFHFSMTTLVIISGCIAFFYVFASGIKAPALISFVKDVLVIGAVIITGVVAVTKVGGVSHLFNIAEQHGAPVTINSSEAIIFAMSTIVFQALGFACAPTIAAVAFTGKSEATMKKTQTFMPLYMLMYPFLIFATYYTFVAAPGLKNPDNAFMATVTSIMPSWLIGLVAAGAALSGLLVLAINCLGLGANVSRNLLPNISERSQRKWVRMVIVMYLLVAIVLTLFTSQLMLTVININYYLTTQILPGLLAVFFSRKINAAGIISGIVVGVVSALTMYFTHVNFYGINIGLIALVLNFIVTFAVSAAFGKNYKLVKPIHNPDIQPKNDDDNPPTVVVE